MEELFIIKDYDTGEPFEYILTDNAIGCKEVIEEFEQRRFDCEDLEWDDFYKMLDAKNIKYQRVRDVESYSY